MYILFHFPRPVGKVTSLVYRSGVLRKIAVIFKNFFPPRFLEIVPCNFFSSPVRIDTIRNSISVRYELFFSPLIINNFHFFFFFFINWIAIHVRVIWNYIFFLYFHNQLHQFPSKLNLRSIIKLYFMRRKKKKKKNVKKEINGISNPIRCKNANV